MSSACLSMYAFVVGLSNQMVGKLPRTVENKVCLCLFCLVFAFCLVFVFCPVVVFRLVLASSCTGNLGPRSSVRFQPYRQGLFLSLHVVFAFCLCTCFCRLSFVFCIFFVVVVLFLSSSLSFVFVLVVMFYLLSFHFCP